MNSSKHLFIFASAVAAIGTALISIGCKKDKAGGGLSEDQRSAHFDAVSQHLDIGGVVFAYVDIDQDAQNLAKDANRLKAMIAESSSGDLPPEVLEQLDFEAMVADLGLDGLRAIGLSSIKNGDRFLNKALLYTPEGRTGIFRLLGGSAQPFTTLKMAPADADLIIEQDLNLKAAMDIGKKMAARFPSGTRTFTDAMQQNMMNLSMTVGDFLGQFDTKIIVIGRVDQEATMALPMEPMASMELPEMELVVGLHNVPWLWEKIKEMMPPDGEEGPFEHIVRDDFEAYLMDDMFGNPKLRPQLCFDKKSDLILIGTSAEFITACLEPTATITSSPDFKAATAGLPTEGNSLSYMSPDVFGAVQKLFEGSVGRTGGDSEIGMEVMKMLMPDHPEGIAGVSVNLDHGILATSNAFESHKSTLLMTANPTAIAVLASMGMPVFTKVQAQAKDAQQISNMRQVILALRTYSLDNNGAFPADLEALTPDYLDEVTGAVILRDLRSGSPEPLMYNAGLTEEADEWLIATPPYQGKRIVGYVDGRVISVDDYLFP